MDMLELMKKRSLPAALGTALWTSVMKTPAAAVLALAAGQLIFYAIMWATAQPVRPLWHCGTRRSSESRRWMRASLCGALCGACVVLGAYALLHARFQVHAPMVTALAACMTARSCTLRVFARRTSHALSPVLGCCAALVCVSVCLYPLL